MASMHVCFLLLFPLSLLADLSEPLFSHFSTKTEDVVASIPEKPSLYLLISAEQNAEELHTLFPQAEILNSDIPNIQSDDHKEILKAKLSSAFQYRNGTFVAENSGLALEALNGLPGPFYTWFQRKMGNHGLVNIALALSKDKAEITSVVGYAKSPTDIYFFEATLKGHIVPLRGKQGGSWDPIFVPEGYTQTLGEMGPVVRNSLDPRRYAFEKLKASIDPLPN